MKSYLEIPLKDGPLLVELKQGICKQSYYIKEKCSYMKLADNIGTWLRENAFTTDDEYMLDLSNEILNLEGLQTPLDKSTSQIDNLSKMSDDDQSRPRIKTEKTAKLNLQINTVDFINKLDKDFTPIQCDFNNINNKVQFQDATEIKLQKNFKKTFYNTETTFCDFFYKDRDSANKNDVFVQKGNKLNYQSSGEKKVNIFQCENKNNSLPNIVSNFQTNSTKANCLLFVEEYRKLIGDNQGSTISTNKSQLSEENLNKKAFSKIILKQLYKEQDYSLTEKNKEIKDNLLNLKKRHNSRTRKSNINEKSSNKENNGPYKREMQIKSDIGYMPYEPLMHRKTNAPNMTPNKSQRSTRMSTEKTFKKGKKSLTPPKKQQPHINPDARPIDYYRNLNELQEQYIRKSEEQKYDYVNISREIERANWLQKNVSTDQINSSKVRSQYSLNNPNTKNYNIDQKVPAVNGMTPRKLIYNLSHVEKTKSREVSRKSNNSNTQRKKKNPEIKIKNDYKNKLETNNQCISSKAIIKNNTKYKVANLDNTRQDKSAKKDKIVEKKYKKILVKEEKSGIVLEFDCQKEDTVRNLKQKICDYMEVKLQNTHQIKDGKILNNSDTLNKKTYQGFINQIIK